MFFRPPPPPPMPPVEPIWKTFRVELRDMSISIKAGTYTVDKSGSLTFRKDWTSPFCAKPPIRSFAPNTWMSVTEVDDAKT